MLLLWQIRFGRNLFLHPQRCLQLHLLLGWRQNSCLTPSLPLTHLCHWLLHAAILCNQNNLLQSLLHCSKSALLALHCIQLQNQIVHQVRPSDCCATTQLYFERTTPHLFILLSRTCFSKSAGRSHACKLWAVARHACASTPALEQDSIIFRPLPTHSSFISFNPLAISAHEYFNQ